MPEDRSPLQEDTAAHQVAASLGFDLVRRYRAIKILDAKALEAAGFLASKPKLDFGKIAAALEAGEPVEGAQWEGVEFVLRSKREP